MDTAQLLLGSSLCGWSLGGGRGGEPNHDVSIKGVRMRWSLWGALEVGECVLLSFLD